MSSPHAGVQKVAGDEGISTHAAGWHRETWQSIGVAGANAGTSKAVLRLLAENAELRRALEVYEPPDTPTTLSPADAWLEAHAAELIRLFPDEEVIVDLATGDIIVHSPDRTANGAFAERYLEANPSARLFHVPVALLAR